MINYFKYKQVFWEIQKVLIQQNSIIQNLKNIFYVILQGLTYILTTFGELFKYQYYLLVIIFFTVLQVLQ